MAVTTRVYDNYTEARRASDAVRALQLPGVETSVLGDESLPERYRDDEVNYQHADSSGAATGAGIGAAVGGGAGLLAGLGLLAIPGLGPLVAAGWVAAAAATAAGGAIAGGAIGALADLGINDEDAPLYSEAMRRGSILVSVRHDEADRMAVEAALGTRQSSDLAHLRARAETEGWTTPAPRYDAAGNIIPADREFDADGNPIPRELPPHVPPRI